MEANKTQDIETKENTRENILEFGQSDMGNSIHLLSVIGEIEGHESLPSNSKTTKYEHVLSQLASIEENRSIRGRRRGSRSCYR